MDKFEFPVKRSGKRVKTEGRWLEVTKGKDPVTGQEIFLHVELKEMPSEPGHGINVSPTK